MGRRQPGEHRQATVFLLKTNAGHKNYRGAVSFKTAYQ
jgi:hypothetical protein